MKNVKATVSGNVLTLVIDLSKEFGPSSSGKTTIVASTEGNVPVDEGQHEGYKMGVNVYKK